MTAAKAAEHGARLATKDELLAGSDIVTIHVVLGDRSRGLIGVRELSLMKPTAYIVNTSRAPIIDEAALLAALRERRIAGAGLDVYYGHEPIAADNPFLALDNTVLTPHLGYTVVENYELVYRQAAAAIAAFLDGKPPANPLNTPSRARA
jgi:phosphoglycerate dehydrogenase-like enzyme